MKNIYCTINIYLRLINNSKQYNYNIKTLANSTKLQESAIQNHAINSKFMTTIFYVWKYEDLGNEKSLNIKLKIKNKGLFQ